MLLAEDNPVNQEIAAGLLETLDCAVTLVENGREAVEAVADQAFDLVLMDCQMPIMDGLDATRAIREAAADDERLPIVALTANDFDNVRSECLAAGMNDLLGKPFTRQELMSLLQRWRPVIISEPATEPTPVVEARTSTLDLKPIEALRSLDPDGGRRFLQRAITKFVDYSDELVTRLASAIAANDVSEVSRIAHSMKSSSANLGATDLARHCATIEKLTRDGDLPGDIDQTLLALQTAHRLARTDLLLLSEGA